MHAPVLGRRGALAAAFAVALPLDAQAQSSDAAYCIALGQQYERYIGGGNRDCPQKDLSAEIAIDKCKSGDTAAGIPLLESKLRNARIDLPKRD